MTDHQNLIVTTKAYLEEIIRDAVARAMRDRKPSAPELGVEEIGKRIRVRAWTIRHWVLHGCKRLRDGRKVGFRAPDMLRCFWDHHAGAEENEGVG